MRLLSWNVNGLRSCVKKGFLAWLVQEHHSIVGLQEVRAQEDQIDDAVRYPNGWHTHFSPAVRKGYSGVALYSRPKPDSIETKLGMDAIDAEGRVQLARFGKLLVANAYFPNGNGVNRDLSRIPFKLDFYRALQGYLERQNTDDTRILVCGDFNTAHQDIDLARPKQNAETSGFRPEERQELSRWFEAGWVDTFRHFETRPGFYSWWSQRYGVREKNIGWRIDYVLASPNALPFVRHAFISHDVLGSDHCPVGVDLDPAIVT